MRAQSGLVALGTQRWTQITDAVLGGKMFKAIWIWREARGLSKKTLWHGFDLEVER